MNDENLNQLERKKRIKKEITRLKKLFKNISKENMQKIAELINRASFLLIIAQDMEAELVECDSFNLTTINASQTFTKTNPLLKDHRDTIKSYQAILKQLNDLTKGVIEDPDDELDIFLNS